MARAARRAGYRPACVACVACVACHPAPRAVSRIRYTVAFAAMKSVRPSSPHATFPTFPPKSNQPSSSPVGANRAGDVLFSEAVMHSPTNISDTDAYGILVELKDQAAQPAAADAGAALGNVLTAVTFIEGRPGAGDDVKRELLTLTPPTRAESGAIAYDLYRSVDQPGRFMRIEVWRDAAALEAHKLSPHLKASFERRKNAGWMTEITRWERVPEEAAEERTALAR